MNVHQGVNWMIKFALLGRQCLQQLSPLSVPTATTTVG